MQLPDPSKGTFPAPRIECAMLACIQSMSRASALLATAAQTTESGSAVHSEFPPPTGQSPTVSKSHRTTVSIPTRARRRADEQQFGRDDALGGRTVSQPDSSPRASPGVPIACATSACIPRAQRIHGRRAIPSRTAEEAGSGGSSIQRQYAPAELADDGQTLGRCQGRWTRSCAARRSSRGTCTYRAPPYPNRLAVPRTSTEPARQRARDNLCFVRPLGGANSRWHPDGHDRKQRAQTPSQIVRNGQPQSCAMHAGPAPNGRTLEHNQKPDAWLLLTRRRDRRERGLGVDDVGRTST